MFFDFPYSMRAFALAFLMSAAALSVACVPGVDVRTARDPNTAFAQFKSFAMLLPNKAMPSKNTEVDPFVLQRLRQLTYLQVKALGLRSAEKESADLLVAVLARRDQRLDVYPATYYGYGYGAPYGYGYWSPGFGGGAWSSQVVRTNEAIVVIDLIDRQKQEVVWRGTGVRSMQSEFDEETLNQMVNAILAESPLVSPP